MGFAATNRTPTSITVKWDPLSLDGVTYKLQCNEKYIENSKDVCDITTDETMFTLTNLKSNTSYELGIISLRNGLKSLQTTITVRTRISGMQLVFVTKCIFVMLLCH